MTGVVRSRDVILCVFFWLEFYFTVAERVYGEPDTYTLEDWYVCSRLTHTLCCYNVPKPS
jgi:hypothetical protein